MPSDPFIEQPDDGKRDLADLLELHARRICGQIHTGLVARVEKFDAAKRSADVQPVVSGRYINGDRFRLPILPNVPIARTGGSTFSVDVPMAKGDYVFVSFGERSIDEWKSTGNKSIEPQDLRRFSLSDGVIVGTINPTDGATPMDPDNMVIGQTTTVGGMAITIYANGKITIGTSAAELLDLIDQTLTALDVFATATIPAAIEPTLGPASTSLKATLATIKIALATIKGP